MDIAPLTRSRSRDFAGEVTGLDLAQEPTKPDVAAIEAGMDRFAVPVFHDQPFDDDIQLAFSRCLGDLEKLLGGEMSKPQDRRLKLEMVDIFNRDRNDWLRGADERVRRSALGNRLRHSDAACRAIRAKYSLLFARVVPGSGGNSEFADMRAACDALNRATKAEIEDLITEHSNAYSRALIGFPRAACGDRNQHKRRPVRQSVVRTHPVTRRKALYLSAHSGTIVGWPMPEARAFVRDLTEHATQPQVTHSHRWRVNDLVMWDNRTTLHRVRRVRDLQDVRDLRRTSIRRTGIAAQQAPAMAAA